MGEVVSAPTSSSGFSLRLLGNLEIHSQGQRLALKTKKEKWLLALLALKAGREVEREWLAGVLWPDSEESQALYNLRRELSNLKADLGVQHTRLQAGYSHAIRLDLSEAEVDVHAFDAAISRNDLASLQVAVAWYQGPLLQDCLEEWIFAERIPREQAYLNALNTLAEHSLVQQQWSESSRYARLLIAVDPLLEGAHRTLMEALAQSGSFAAATQVYRDLRLRLREELNAEPDAASRHLFERIRGEAKQRLASPSGHAMSAPSASLPVADSPLPPIPRPLTGLIGQEEALTEILTLLPSTRLLTLTGTGGVGKTRLALEVAQQAAKMYAESVAFVDLSGLTDSHLLPQAFAGALGLREETGAPLNTTLSTFLQLHPLLLVVDNCEHLLQDCAQLIHHLLQSAPAVRVLATSRQVLRLPGEVVWRVASLAFPPEKQRSSVRRTKQEPSELLEYPAVRLFVERVRQATPEFRLTPAALEIIGNICQRLDGIPLALELAAGRVRALSLEQISARLQDRFRLLTGGNRAALPRQQTLRALIDWSYGLLEEGEKRLLACLSAFAGGWTLEAAEAVCFGEAMEEWEVLDLLTSLVDKSLVIMEEQGEGEARYRMLETIRQYAQEQWHHRVDEHIAVMRRLRDYYSVFVQDLYSQQFKADGAHWLARAETEQDNLRSVLDFCCVDLPSLPQGLKMAGYLFYFWWMRGFLSEGSGRLESLLERDREKRPTAERFEAINAAGLAARMRGDYPIAQECAEEALQITIAIEDPYRMSQALSQLAGLYYYLGKYDQALDYSQRALAVQEKGGFQNHMSATLNTIGLILDDQQKYVEALSYKERALAISRQLGNRQWELRFLLNLGVTATELHDEGGARTYYQQALALSEELGDRIMKTRAFLGFGNIALTQKRPAEAEAFYLQGLSDLQEFGERERLAECLFDMCNASLLQGKWEQAVCLFTAAEGIFEEIGGIHTQRVSTCEARLREQFYNHLGQEAFASAQEQARTLTPDERIARILADAQA